MVAAGAAYLLWWVAVELLLPNAFNPLGSRLAVVACFFAVAGASHVSKGLARRLASALTALCAIGTAHYFYLFDQNHAGLDWVVGSYVTVIACCAILQSSRSLVLYSLWVLALSVGMLIRQPGLANAVFLPGMITNLVLVNAGMHARFRLLERLRESLAETQQAEAELRRANRALESFSYSVAHDLRSPLRAINGFSKVLLQDHAAELSPDARRSLERVASGGETMGKLIEGLLDLARLSRSELRRQSVNLSDLATTIITQLRASQPERTVDFVCQSGIVANGDEALLRAALDNLLRNAWKFTLKTSAPRIELGSTVEAGVTTYFVRDNGAGFDMAYVNKLFGPFQRLHTTREFAGTGIGLATVHRIIERHGGKVWAEGAVNAGATFFFTCPSSAAHPVGPAL